MTGLESIAAAPNAENAARRRDPLVLIVILNWDNAEQTASAVRSVLAMNYINYRLLVIDNGSREPGALDCLPTDVAGRIEVLKEPLNLGYTGGCNLGLARALEIHAEYVWLLNNDATTGLSTLSSLVNTASADSHIGLVSPQVASDDREHHITFTGGVCDLENLFLDATGDAQIADDWLIKHPACGFVSGAALLVRVSVIRDIGMLDESFFAYYEDTDYSVRSAQAGYQNVVDRNAVVYHSEKRINEDPCSVKPHYWYYMARNEIRFWRKHLGLRRSLRPCWWCLRRYFRRSEQIRENHAARAAIFAGIWHGIWNRGGPYEVAFRAPKPLEYFGTWYARR